MVVFSMLEKQYKFRSIISNKKVPKKFGNLILIVISLKTKGYNHAPIFCVFKIFIFINPTDFQPFKQNTPFCYLLYKTRKVLSLLGFENVNPENDKFQKKSYLDSVQTGFLCCDFMGNFQPDF